MPAFLPEEAARFQTKGFLWEIPHVPHFAGQPAFSAWQESAAGLRSFPGFPGYPAFDFWRRVLCILFRRHFENDRLKGLDETGGNHRERFCFILAFHRA